MAGEQVRLGGVVVTFSNEKGYGFIKPNNGGDDLFVHRSDVIFDDFRTLSSGQEVEFFSFEENDRFKAIEVTAPGGGAIKSVHVGGRTGYGYNRRNSNGYRNGSGGGGECYTGGRNGRVARDCDVGIGGGGARGGGRECHKCGRIGHFARECRQGEGAVVASVRGGGRSGGGGGAGCYNCGGYGHMSRECPSERTGGCNICGKPGHMARDCPRGGNNGGGGGRDGGGGGGVSRFTSFASGNTCLHCGGLGHSVIDCPEKN